MGIKTGHLKCSSCGAPLDLPEGSLVKSRIKCSFCGVENFIYNEDISSGGMNFELSDAGVHRHLIGILSSGDFPPHDIFNEVVISKVNKLVIPAYWYENCTAIGTMLYEQGVDKKVITYDADTGFDKETKTEWKPMSRAFSTTRDFILSGSEQYSGFINKMFQSAKRNVLKKADELTFPDDCIEINCDLTEGTIFAGTLRELAEKAIDETGRNALEKDNKQIYSKIEDITVQKGEVKKVSIAVYEIIYDYKGKEFNVYLSGDGENHSFDELPEDPAINARIEEKVKEMEEIENSKKRLAMVYAIVILVIVGILLAAAVIGIFFLIAAGILAILYIPKEKERRAKIKAVNDLVDELKSGFSKKRAEFNTNKVAMKGVLNHVSGDPEAFEDVNETSEEKASDESKDTKNESAE